MAHYSQAIHLVRLNTRRLGPINNGVPRAFGADMQPEPVMTQRNVVVLVLVPLNEFERIAYDVVTVTG